MDTVCLRCTAGNCNVFIIGASVTRSVTRSVEREKNVQVEMFKNGEEFRNKDEPELIYKQNAACGLSQVNSAG